MDLSRKWYVTLQQDTPRSHLTARLTEQEPLAETRGMQSYSVWERTTSDFWPGLCHSFSQWPDKTKNDIENHNMRRFRRRSVFALVYWNYIIACGEMTSKFPSQQYKLFIEPLQNFLMDYQHRDDVMDVNSLIYIQNSVNKILIRPRTNDKQMSLAIFTLLKICIL